MQNNNIERNYFMVKGENVYTQRFLRSTSTPTLFWLSTYPLLAYVSKFSLFIGEYAFRWSHNDLPSSSLTSCYYSCSSILQVRFYSPNNIYSSALSEFDTDPAFSVKDLDWNSQRHYRIAWLFVECLILFFLLCCWPPNLRL